MSHCVRLGSGSGAWCRREPGPNKDGLSFPFRWQRGFEGSRGNRVRSVQGHSPPSRVVFHGDRPARAGWPGRRRFSKRAVCPGAGLASRRFCRTPPATSEARGARKMLVPGWMRVLRLPERSPPPCVASTTDMCFSVLEAGSPGSRCGQGWVLPRAAAGPSPWLVDGHLHAPLAFSPRSRRGPDFPFRDGHQPCWMRGHPRDLILT